jgi:hypothetical protein
VLLRLERGGDVRHPGSARRSGSDRTGVDEDCALDRAPDHVFRSETVNGEPTAVF